MSKLDNWNREDTLLYRAAFCKKVSRPPIWMMRQAGRYMPSYREMRSKYSFQEMYKNPEIAAEVTLLPINTFGFDAAILFSDILVIPEALGQNLRFEEGKGPILSPVIRSQEDFKQLNSSEFLSRLEFVRESIKLLLPSLHSKNIPLIGFSGAPFTLASYMIEGASSATLKNTKKLMFSNKKLMHSFLDLLSKCTIEYLNMQIEAGVDALQIFDSWLSVLSWDDAKEFSLPYLEKILRGLNNPEHIPLFIFARGSSVFAPLIEEICPDVISLDWNCDIKSMRQTINPKIALQGNLDPFALYAPKNILEEKVNSILEKMRDESGFIFNLGHGIFPDVSQDQVQYVVDLVKESSYATN